MEIFVATVAVLFAAFLISWIPWLTGRRRHGRNQQRLAPGPRGWPLLGALPYLGEFPHKSLLEMSKKYGPVMHVRLGSVSTLVISNAEMAKEVFNTNDQTFSSRPQLLALSVLSYGEKDIAWAPYGSHWRQVRKIVTLHLLTSSRLARFTNIMKGEILSTVHNMLEQSQQSGGKGFDVSLVFNGMALNIITQMMWKKTHSSFMGNQSALDKKFGEIVKRTMAVAGSNNVADFLPSFLKFFAMRVSGLGRKVMDVHEDFDSFCENILREKEEALVKETKAAADEDDDFVDVLLKLKTQADDSRGLSREVMKGILTDMITAGTDTTSVSLDWLLTELIKHPEIMKKAQDELTTVVGDDRLVNESDIPNLKYLDAVIKEGFRKHSALPLALPRFTLADCKVGGYDVPAHTTVFINLFAIHHNSATWENPWEFNPDRFLESERTYKGHGYELMPFGSGRRMCPGLNLASTVLHLSLAQFLHAVRWSLPEGHGPEDVDMREAPGLSVVRATPLFVNAAPRLAHHVTYPAVAAC